MEPFCATLASSPDWVAEVASDWPGPIAHEYDRLLGGCCRPTSSWPRCGS